jgi:tRNA 2-thiouridine synthesizing protein A
MGGGRNMLVVLLDAKGLKCPQPTIQMTIKALKLKKENVLEVVADCSTFENDVKNWCRRNNKTLLWIRDEGEGVKRCQVQF